MKNKFILLFIYLNKVLSIFGLNLSRDKKPVLYDPVNFKCHHPRTIQNKEFNRTFLLRVPINLGRTSSWFSLSDHSLDPMLAPLREALKRNFTNNDMYVFLKHMFKVRDELVVALDAASMAGINSDGKSLLSGYPAWSLVLPWEDASVEDKFRTFPVAVKKDRYKSGFKINSNDPIEIMRLNKLASFDSHIRQYVNLLDSIGKRGVLQGGRYGYISAFILMDGDSWRWIIGGEGNHRAVVASALDYSELDVLVDGVVRKEDSRWWPNVCNGLYTTSQAEKVFDDIFNANPSPVYSSWISYFTNEVEQANNFLYSKKKV